MLLFYLSLVDAPELKRDEFEALYIAYRAAMFQAAYAVARNKYDAEDAVHNAFIAVARNISVVCSLAPKKQKSYLCRAARNHAINIRSKQCRERQFFETNGAIFSSGDEDDILESICQKEDVARIKQCVLALPDIYRDVLYLHYVEYMDARRIAGTLGLKIPAVRQRLARGKRMLIDALNGKDVRTCEEEGE